MRVTTKVWTAVLGGFLALLAGCAGRAAGAGVGNVGWSGSTTALASSADHDATTGFSVPGGDPRASSPRSSGPVGIDELSGRTYLSTAVVGRTLADGTIIALRFGGAELSASAGCNTLSGPYATGAGRLTAGGLRIDKPIPCPSAVSEETSWLADFLGAGPTWRLAGHRLSLTSGSTTIYLTDRNVSAPTVTIHADELRLQAPDGRGPTFTAVNGVDAPVPPTQARPGR